MANIESTAVKSGDSAVTSNYKSGSAYSSFVRQLNADANKYAQDPQQNFEAIQKLVDGGHLPEVMLYGTQHNLIDHQSKKNSAHKTHEHDKSSTPEHKITAPGSTHDSSTHNSSSDKGKHSLPVSIEQRANADATKIMSDFQKNSAGSAFQEYADAISRFDAGHSNPSEQLKFATQLTDSLNKNDVMTDMLTYAELNNKFSSPPVEKPAPLAPTPGNPGGEKPAPVSPTPGNPGGEVPVPVTPVTPPPSPIPTPSPTPTPTPGGDGSSGGSTSGGTNAGNGLFIDGEQVLQGGPYGSAPTSAPIGTLQSLGVDTSIGFGAPIPGQVGVAFARATKDNGYVTVTEQASWVAGTQVKIPIPDGGFASLEQQISKTNTDGSAVIEGADGKYYDIWLGQTLAQGKVGTVNIGNLNGDGTNGGTAADVTKLLSAISPENGTHRLIMAIPFAWAKQGNPGAFPTNGNSDIPAGNNGPLQEGEIIKPTQQQADAWLAAHPNADANTVQALKDMTDCGIEIVDSSGPWQAGVWQMGANQVDFSQFNSLLNGMQVYDKP